MHWQILLQSSCVFVFVLFFVFVIIVCWNTLSSFRQYIIWGDWHDPKMIYKPWQVVKIFLVDEWTNELDRGVPGNPGRKTIQAFSSPLKCQLHPLLSVSLLPPPFAIHFDVWCQIVRPQCALIVVDVQNDFISGSLAIDEASTYWSARRILH